jgi:hypothetical protein
MAIKRGAHTPSLYFAADHGRVILEQSFAGERDLEAVRRTVH